MLFLEVNTSIGATDIVGFGNMSFRSTQCPHYKKVFVCDKILEPINFANIWQRHSIEEAWPVDLTLASLVLR